MRLFRYLDSNAVRLSVVGRSLKVSRLLALNDPFEWRFAVTGMPPEVHQDMEAVIQRCIAEFGAKYGLLCFSASASESVLWSHYADRHSGGVLELEVNPNPECCVRVEYSDQRPAFEVQELLGPDWSRAVDRVFPQLWQRKSKGWAYEQEYRYYVPLDACEHRDGMHFTPLVPRMLRRVILGWRCSIEEETMTKLLNTAGYSNCLIARARPGISSYAVEC